MLIPAIRAILIALAFAAAMFLDLRPVHAQFAQGNGAWCAIEITGEDSHVESCVYRSLEACRPVVIAGNRGFCRPNPYIRAEAVPVRKVRKHRRAY